jgi:hypothetical protein
MIALLMLMVAATRGPRRLVGFASLLVTLALVNKVQILFLIGALPILLIPAGGGRVKKNCRHGRAGEFRILRPKSC